MAGTQTPADVAAAEHRLADAVATHGADSPEARDAETDVHVALQGLHTEEDIDPSEEEINL